MKTHLATQPKMTTRKNDHPRVAGMTLIELLVALGVIAVVSGLLAAGLTTIRESARTAAATGGARSLIQAYLLSPTENNGRYLMGYGNPGKTIHSAADRPLAPSSEQAKRYPWRIAPLLDGGVKALYVGEHAEFYERKASKSAYTASLHPSFGMNSVFVGGHYDGRKHDPSYSPGRRSRNTSPYPSEFWVLRPGDARNPSDLIVFASTRYSPPADYGGAVGFFRINAPQSPASPNWGDYDPAIPASLGFVSLEYGGKAVVAHLDGSVRLLDEKQLRDMRRWSNQAALYDDPDFSDWERD